jgi:hypothetical protein
MIPIPYPGHDPGRKFITILFDKNVLPHQAVFDTAALKWIKLQRRTGLKKYPFHSVYILYLF